MTKKATPAPKDKRRITSDLAATIARRLVDYSHKPKLDKAIEAMKKIGDQIYQNLVPEKYRKIMDQLPDDYFAANGSVWVSVPNSKGNLRTVRLCVSDFTKLPAFLYRSQPTVDGALGRKAYEADVAYSLAHEEMRAAQKTALKMIRQFKTVGQLLENWPEIAPFVPPSDESVSKSKSLALPPDNALFNLPVKGKRAKGLAKAA